MWLAKDKVNGCKLMMFRHKPICTKYGYWMNDLGEGLASRYPCWEMPEDLYISGWDQEEPVQIYITKW